jgi:hypothetical protein
MAWSHNVTGYAPGVGPRSGIISLLSAATSTLTSPPLRLADILNANSKFLQHGPPVFRDALINLQGLDVRGLRFAVPNVIVRFGPVTAATHSGTTVTVTVGSGHNIQTGESVTIRQVVDAVEINGIFAGSRIARVSDTVFTITGVASMTAFATSANSIVEVVRPFASVGLTSYVPATKLFTTSAAHNLAPGDKIFVSQVTGLTFAGGTFLNKPVTVATTPSTTTFTIYENVASTGTSSGGNVTAVRTVNNYGMIKVLQPRAIGIASITAADPAVYTTGVAHGLSVGDRVLVSGVAGTSVTALNVPAVVRTVPLTTTFTLESEAGVPVSGSGATITPNTGYVSVTAPTPIATLNENFPWQISILNNPTKEGAGTGPFHL